MSSYGEKKKSFPEWQGLFARKKPSAMIIELRRVWLILEITGKPRVDKRLMRARHHG